jgi:hypothetical protein
MVHGALAAALLLAAAPPPGAPPAGAEEALRARLDAGLPARAAGPERAAWATGLLLGAPYRTSPLGEGSGPDPDPRFRLDAFDCVTLVETALALGAARSTDEAASLLDGIRYSGAPGWATRNHYVESQWIPALVEGGWLVPATTAVAAALVRPATKSLDDAAWARAERAGHALPDLPPERRPRGTFSLDVVPLARVPEIAARIPHGTVLLVVRADRDDRPTRVTHMGLMVVGADGVRRVRHASDVPGVLRVRDEPLSAFLERAARRRWKVEGVSLFTILPPSARAGAPQKANTSSPPASTAAPATP